MHYQLTDDTTIIRHNDDGSTSYIPACEDNRDWKEYQVWLAAGNTPDPA